MGEAAGAAPVPARSRIEEDAQAIREVVPDDGIQVAVAVQVDQVRSTGVVILEGKGRGDVGEGAAAVIEVHAVSDADTASVVGGQDVDVSIPVHVTQCQPPDVRQLRREARRAGRKDSRPVVEEGLHVSVPDGEGVQVPVTVQVRAADLPDQVGDGWEGPRHFREDPLAVVLVDVQGLIVARDQIQVSVSIHVLQGCSIVSGVG